MPVHECQENGRPGYKWGDKGNCYDPKDSTARAKAMADAHKQGAAAMANGAKE